MAFHPDLLLHAEALPNYYSAADLKVPCRTALVGKPGSSGLSVEQRKRLTIAVELVANPSIIFMDEPTSGENDNLPPKFLYLF